MPVAQAPHPAGLQLVLGVEQQAGRLGQAARPHTLREVPRHVGRAGGGHIAHHAQRLAVAAGGRPRGAGDGGHHRAGAQPFGRVVLVVHAQLHQHRRLGREGGQRGREPGGQAVGVDGHRQVDPRPALGGDGRQRVGQFLLQQAHAVHVLAHAAPGVGGPAGLAAHHQRAAHALFQQADALRDRRGRDVQRARRAVKAALAHHGGQGMEGGVVQHRFSFS